MNKLLFLLSILFTCSVLHAEQPLKAPDSFPKYRLSNIRIENDAFGRAEVVCDYNRSESGTDNNAVRFVAKTESGILDIMGPAMLMDQKSGEIRLSKLMPGFGRRSVNNYEIYLVVDARWAGKSYGACMVSNAVRTGKPGSPTKARTLNADEKEAYKRHQLDKKPPAAAPPAEAEFVNLSSELLPGMYVQAGRYGEWEKAEFFGLTDQRDARLRFEGENRIVTRPVEKWIAVDPEVLAKGKSDPDSFKPSGQTLEGGRMLIPPDAVPLTGSMDLVPGTPLLYAMGSTWKEVTFTRKSGSGLSYRLSKRMTMDQEAKRNKFAIRKTDVERLEQPDAKEHFAENVAEEDDDDSEMGFGSDAFREHKRRVRERVRDCKIRSAIPKDCQVVPNDLEVPEGTKVAACFHFDWSEAEVISDPGNGTLELDWDEHAAAFNGRVKKEQIIIQNKTLKKLEKNSGMSLEEFKKVTRTWTDISGEHKVKAKFVSMTSTEVTLKLKDGSKKTLPIDKLSEEDQEVLKKLKVPAENPFAN